MGASAEFLLAPHLLDVFFSVRKGLIYWTPLVLVAIAGLPLLRRAAPALFVPVVAYLVAQHGRTESGTVNVAIAAS